MKHIRIALNTLSAQAGGGVSAFVNLMPALADIDKENQYIVFVSDKQKEILDAIPPSFKKVTINYLLNSYVRVLWEQLIFPSYLLLHRVDVLYSTGNITTLLAPCKIVLLIENSNPYSPLNIEWPKRELLRNKFLKCLGWISAKRANKVRFVSDNSKRLIARKLNLPLEKCITIYHGYNINDKFQGNAKNKFESGYNYILTVAIVAPHKNLEMLIKAFDVLIKQYDYSGNLVIVGDLCYAEYAKKLQCLVSELKLQDRVVFFGKVLHKDMGTYYTHADVFVLPSIVETFGIPAIEAMGCGVPVAVSDGSLYEDYFIPFREICGEAAHYFDPFDPADIGKSVNKIISDNRYKYKEQLRLNGLEQAQRYKWEDTAKSLVKVFNEV